MRPENFTSTKSGWIVVYCAEFCELNLVHFFKWTELSSIIIPRKILNLNWTKFKFCRMNLNWTVFMKKVNLMITDVQVINLVLSHILLHHNIASCKSTEQLILRSVDELLCFDRPVLLWPNKMRSTCLQHANLQCSKMKKYHRA